jgi:hypothetical protein
MLRPSLLAVTLAFALVSGGCVTTPPYDPFKVPREEIYSKIKTIALAPVGIPGNIQDPDAVKAKFEALIEAKLREAGFTIVPSRETAGIWDRMNKQLGGMFDPVTGKRDETKFKSVREHFLREVETKFKADAVLHPNIRTVMARFAGGQANWDGVSESLSPTEGFMGMLSVGQFQGTVGALSLVVTIENIHGVDAYVNGGGIQLVSKLSGGKFIPVLPGLLLTNEARNTAAANIALEPLVKTPAPAEAPKVKP